MSPCVVVEARSPLVEGVGNQENGARRLTLGRVLFLVLGGIALIYALLAGLRTVTDPDFGWQMASGRWIVQHHYIPSTDIFSYTATGSPWIYPVAGELLFYGIYLLGGFALLSWIGALTCVGTVAILLRRGSAFTAAVAILGIPLIADRTVPRGEMFTVLLFAAFLLLLWENYETSRAPLFWLPVLMVAWVNLHLGFIAGFALIAGFAGLDVLELFFGKARRTAALRRLKRALPWYAATGVATLINPWGWNLFQALVRQNRAMAGQEKIIAEWAGMHFNWHGWHAFFGSFSLQPIQYTLAVMMVVVAISALAALLQLQPGAAILLGGAMYASIRYVRMEALTACVVIVIGGAMLTRAGTRLGEWVPFARVRAAFAIMACLAFVAIAVVRMREYQSNYVYLASNARSDFGAGLSWWFPKDAADFVNREKLPANVFNSFNEGGYIVWALGERSHDYMDGRSVPFGMEGFARERELLGSPIDSPRWQQEAGKYNLNTILIQLDSEEVRYDQLQDLCYANNWKPVYIDEISMVLVRNTPQNQELLKRLQISCPAATVPSAPMAYNSRTFQRWLNSAYILLALRRTNEALAAANAALSINPNSASVHWVRGDIFYATSRRAEAEREWLTTLALSHGTNEANIWSKLAQLYLEQERTKDAIYAWLQTLGSATDPLLKTQAYVQLSRLYVGTGNLKPALQMLDDAVKTAPQGMPGIKGGSFAFDVAQDRAAIWFRLGDVPKAVSFQEEALRLDPNQAEAWAHLALLYQKAGRTADQQRAEERVKTLTAKPKQ
jgi:tetratricopeptide (TPR) repeat protein